MDDSPSLRTAGFSLDVLKDCQKREKFVLKLSYCQQSSFEVLLEWWEARRLDRNVDQDAKEAQRQKVDQDAKEARSRVAGSRGCNIFPYHDIVAWLKDFEIYKHFTRRSSKPSELTRLRRSERNVNQNAKEAQSCVSGLRRSNIFTYHDILARLEDSEIHRHFTHRSSKPSELTSLRRKAIYYAACERITSSYCKSIPPPRNALLTRNRPLHGASLVPEIPFNYESPYESSYESPYYLWDCQRREVCSVEEIIRTEGSFPDYAAISHSWVRWQDKSAPWLELPGVPWKIPRNSKFDVEKLPDMLSTLPWRYVWIDLLTIPQGFTLPDTLLKRKDWEIKCVPLIFRKALKAIVWFDDIPSWSSLPAALAYLSLQFLSASFRTGVDQGPISSSLKTAAAAADKPLELLDHDQSRQTPAVNVWEPNGWFTSPWSLQETIMRPDILLCNEKWEFLEICNGVPVAMNDIAALLKVVSETAEANLPQPLCVQELSQLFERVGLMHLLELTNETSVDFVPKIAGCSSTRVKEYPILVPFSGTVNPHRRPTKMARQMSEGTHL